jgi:hypothetical protein
MNIKGHYENNEYLIFKYFLYQANSHSMMREDFDFKTQNKINLSIKKIQNSYI